MTVFAGRLEEPFLSNIKDFYRIDGLKNWSCFEPGCTPNLVDCWCNFILSTYLIYVLNWSLLRYLCWIIHSVLTTTNQLLHALKKGITIFSLSMSFLVLLGISKVIRKMYSKIPNCIVWQHWICIFFQFWWIEINTGILSDTYTLVQILDTRWRYIHIFSLNYI